MASGVSQIGKLNIAQQNLDLETEAALKEALVNDTYTFDANEDFVDVADAFDVQSLEIAVTGYVGGFGGAGRKVPASRTLTRDDPNGRIEYDHADTTWTALGAGVTIGGVVGLVEKTADTDSWVIYFDDSNNVGTNGGDITYAPNAEGILQF